MKEEKKSFKITPELVDNYLGPRKFKKDVLEKSHEIGLVNGLAWTEVGGELLNIESTVTPGSGKFTLTGKLGDVMKESCSAAMSYIRSRGPLFGYDKDFFAETDVHIHLPEGAIPKDGPSAGIGLVTSIVSSITKIPVRREVAMTGEVTLRGRVLPIGGLKEKIMAAHRSGMKTILIPEENQKDLKDIPEKVLNDLEFVIVNHVDQVLAHALDVKDAKEIFKNKVNPSLGIQAKYKGGRAFKH